MTTLSFGGHLASQSPAVILQLRWSEPIYYMRVGYVFNLRFSEWKIHPIFMIFGILYK